MKKTIMKTFPFVVCVMLITGKMHAQEDTSIKNVLEQETIAFFKHDFIQSFSFWQIIPQSTAVVSQPDGQVIFLTNKELNAENTAKSLQTSVFPDRFERSNWLFRIKDNSAYVSFLQTVFTGNTRTGQTYESRYMEKVKGQWKIISMTVVNFKNK